MSLRVFTNRARQGCLVSVLRPGRVDQCKVDLTFFPSDKYVRLALEGVEGLDGSINNPNVVSLHLSGVMSSYNLLEGGGGASQNQDALHSSSDALPAASMNPLPLHGNISGSESDPGNHSDLSEIGNNQFESDIMNAVAGEGGWDPITQSPKQSAKRGLRSPPNITADLGLSGQPLNDFGRAGGGGLKSSSGSVADDGASGIGNAKNSGRKDGSHSSSSSSSSGGGGSRNIGSGNGKSGSGTGSNPKKKPSPSKKRQLEKDDLGRKAKRSKSDSPESKSSSPSHTKTDERTNSDSGKQSSSGNGRSSAQNQAALIIAASSIPESAMRGAKWRSSSSGLKYRDVAYGQGTEAKAGSKIKVRYTGRLHNAEGKIFDQNIKKGMKLTLGLGRVIQGWDFGLLGVRAGGIRQLLIPSNMAYGRKGVPGTIPSNTALWFEVQISSVR